MTKVFSTVTAFLVVLLTVSPIRVSPAHASESLFVTDSVSEKVFATEISTIVKNANIIALMKGEKPASSATMLTAAKESKYADSETEASSWGSKGSISKGDNGSITVKRKNRYLLEKVQKSLTGSVKCKGLIKVNKNKIVVKKITCKG